ncbi:MAG TPA: hypothetical protein VGS79_06960 [Puia sp.]|nr:hypothetical protein [Puia sp.]
MKKYPLFFLILCVVAVWSCHKSNSSKNPMDSGYYVSSAVSVSAGARIVDSFDYDSAHRVTQFIQTRYDTTTGTAITAIASAQFTLPAGTNPPTGYAYTISGNTVIHTLSYDNQGRIIKDTCPTTGFVSYYSYPNGNIAATILFTGTAQNNQIDTIYLNSGNATTINTWAPNNAGTADSLQGSLKFGYSSIANPMYHASITSSIGPLLYTLAVQGLGGGMDPISQKAPSSFSGTIDGLPPGLTLNFKQTTDSKGRLSTLFAGVVGFGSETIYFNYY